MAQAILLPKAPHIVEEGRSTRVKLYFWGENKNVLDKNYLFWNENGHFEDEGDILKRNFIAFKSFPLKTTFV